MLQKGTNEKERLWEAAAGVPLSAAQCSLAPSPQLCSVQCSSCTSPLLSVICILTQCTIKKVDPPSTTMGEHNFVREMVKNNEKLTFFFRIWF